MKTLNKHRRWLAAITCLILLTAWIPGSVFAASYIYAPEETRLLKTETRDPDGKIINITTYNEMENVLESQDYMPQDPEYSFREVYTYDWTGENVQEYRSYSSGKLEEKQTYQYDSDGQLIKLVSRDKNNTFLWSEEFIYNASGNIIREEGRYADGAYFIIVTQYDDAGRETYSNETTYVDGHTDVWNTYYTYKESGNSWSKTTSVYDYDDQFLYDYTESYNYDSKGNLTSSVEYEDGDLYHNKYYYDSDDQVIKIETTIDEGPDQMIDSFIYRYDHKIQKENLSINGQNYTTDYIYTVKPFSDVIDTEYFSLPVKWAMDLGITSGTSATTFSPYDSCTRAQAVTFLWRAAHQPEPMSSKNPFKDVSPSDYYYKAVLWAVEQGITKGISDNEFGPGQTCTRAQIVTFLHRFRGEPGIGGTVSFTDVHEGDYFYGAVLWALADKITNGTTSTTFSPGDNCTRGQIVTFLFRTLTVG